MVVVIPASGHVPSGHGCIMVVILNHLLLQPVSINIMFTLTRFIHLLQLRVRDTVVVYPDKSADFHSPFKVTPLGALFCLKSLDSQNNR